VHTDVLFIFRYMCGFCQETFTDFNLVQEHVKQHVSDSPQVNILCFIRCIPGLCYTISIIYCIL